MSNILVGIAEFLLGLGGVLVVFVAADWYADWTRARREQAVEILRAKLQEAGFKVTVLSHGHPPEKKTTFTVEGGPQAKMPREAEWTVSVTRKRVKVSDEAGCLTDVPTNLYGDVEQTLLQVMKDLAETLYVQWIKATGGE